MIISTTKEKYLFGENVGLLFPAEQGKPIDALFAPDLNYYTTIKDHLQLEITEEKIQKELSQANMLTLQLTQNCNLRCGYCAYSGIYEHSRIHNPAAMTFQTAQQAIDFFFSTISSPNRLAINKTISITFYGGETLLEFDTLRQTVEYARQITTQLHFLPKFKLTTNGVLLTPEKTKWFSQQNIPLDISLDGPQEEHDRFRKDIHGHGSFARIMENISHIQSQYPSYFKEKIRFFLTLHPNHDLNKIESFLLNHPNLFNNNNIKVNYVRLSNLEKNIENEWYEALEKQTIQKKQTLQKDKWFYHHLIEDPIKYHFFSGSSTDLRVQRTTFTGTCFPGGTRVFVAVDGSLHICEKISEHFSIGDVFNGFNIEKIKTILESWHHEIQQRECWHCECATLCTFCFANRSAENQFVLSATECHKLKTISKNLLKDYLSFMEGEDEKIPDTNSTSMPAFLDSLQ